MKLRDDRVLAEYEAELIFLAVLEILYKYASLRIYLQFEQQLITRHKTQ